MIKKFIKIVLLFITDKQYRTKILAWLGMYDNLSDEDYIKKCIIAILEKKLI